MNKLKDVYGYLGDVEEEFDCSGVCTKKGIYYFSDVTRGQPTDSCKASLKGKWLSRNVTNYGVGFLIMALFICVPWILNFVLCCLPGKGTITNKITIV